MKIVCRATLFYHAHKMEFTFGDYEFRLVLNPTDFILRAEHVTTHRVYEGAFRGSDFSQYVAIGGLDFVIKLIQGSLQSAEGATLTVLETTAEHLRLGIRCAALFFPRPIEIELKLPSIRRADAAIGLDTVGRRVKELEERVLELEDHVERLSVFERVFGNIMILPGIPQAIPRNSPKLYLLQDGCGGPFEITGTPWTSGEWLTSSGFSNYSSYDFTAQGVYGFKKYIDLAGLSIASCTSLSIASNTITDFSPLQYIESLTDLTICGYLTWTGSGALPFTLYSTSLLNDISWIRNLKNLTTLRLIGCTHLTDADPKTNLKNLAPLTKLKTLDIRLSPGLTNITTLNPHLTILRS